MNENNKKQIIILGVLGVLLGGVLWFQVIGPMMGGSGGASVEARTPSSQPGQITGDASQSRVESVFKKVDIDIESLLEEIQVVEFDYAEETVDRDPTAPLVDGNMLLTRRPAVRGSGRVDETLLAAANRKDVTGIVWDPAKPLAVIDNEVVHVGFEFQEPIVVKAIERNRVVLGLIGQDHEVVRELKEQ